MRTYEVSGTYTDMGDFTAYYDRILAEAPRGSTLVEVGIYVGASLSQLAVGGYEKGCRVLGVDWGRGLDGVSPTANEFVVNLARTNIPHSVPVIVWDSGLSAQFFADRSVWFVYLDAAHGYYDVQHDIRYWEPKVKRGGILAGHDYNMPGVKRAVDEKFGECQSRTDPYVWEVRRGLWGWKRV